jgi:hypothetical protein
MNSLNTQIVEAMLGWKHVFLLAQSVEMGED